MFPLYNQECDYMQAFAAARQPTKVAMQNTVNLLVQAADCARRVGDDVTMFFDAESFFEIFVKKGCDTLMRWKKLDLNTDSGVSAVRKLAGWSEWEPGDTRGRGASLTSAFLRKVAKEVGAALDGDKLSSNARRFVQLVVDSRPALDTELAETISKRNRSAANLGD